MKLTRRSLLTVLFLSVFVPAANAQTAPAFKDLYNKTEMMIPMRDGIRLYTAVYAPKNAPGKHPILLERTPYGAGPYGPENYRRGVRGSHKFIANGYIFAFQEVRGSDKSEGVFMNIRPLLINRLNPADADESTDTYDAIDYLVKHIPDNNGRVGLWGISYPGFYAGIGAVSSHPALKVASPQAPVSDWFLGDDFHHNGALFLMDSLKFARFGESDAVAAREKPMDVEEGDDPYHFFLQHGALDELTRNYLHGTDGMWKYLMEHGTYDDYWQARSLPCHMKNVHCAVMTVGGLFDAEDYWGALHTYRETEAQNRGIVNCLVLGPWSHGMWGGPGGSRLGDIEFGQQTTTDYQEKIEFPFFDGFLRGHGRPHQPEAEIFETGANRWRNFAHWPPKEIRQESLFLLPDKRVGTDAPALASGAAFDAYVSDPANPVPYQGGEIHRRTATYVLDDQRFASARSDVLTYQMAPQTVDLHTAGPITANLYVETTGTDADFVVKVIDVYPADAPGKMANYQMLVRADVFRARFRKSFSNPSALPANTVESVSFDLPDVCHDFRTGHRLMVQIQSSWFPLVDRNPQRFVDIATAKPEDFQKATIRIYHTPQYPSNLRIGVLPN